MNPEYKNPDLEIANRPIYGRKSPMYNIMIKKIHEVAHSSNPRTYDVTHHSIETRNSKLRHNDCVKLTKANYSGKTEQETEETFWRKAEAGGFANNFGMRAVYFAELELFNTKLYLTLQAHKNKAPKQDTSPQTAPINPPTTTTHQFPLFYAQNYFPYVQPNGLFIGQNLPQKVSSEVPLSQPSNFSKPIPPSSQDERLIREQNISQEHFSAEQTQQPQTNHSIGVINRKSIEDQLFALQQSNDQLSNMLVAVVNKINQIGKKPKGQTKRGKNETEIPNENADEMEESLRRFMESCKEMETETNRNMGENNQELYEETQKRVTRSTTATRSTKK